MIFAWDSEKAAANLWKHGVDFREAATVFNDSLSTTYPDIDHSRAERRFVMLGMSARRRVVVVAYTEHGETELSAPDLQPGARDDSMKKTDDTVTDDLRPEYDFASMKGGVRGKYAKRFREGTNIVLIDPEMTEAFPTEAAVNEALRGVLSTARAVRNGGGLPNKALQPTSRAKRSSTRRTRSRAARG